MAKSIFSYFLTFFFCLFSLVGISGYYFSDSIFNTEKYMDAIIENDYDGIVCKTVEERLDSIGDEISLDSDTIYSFLDKKGISEYSREYVKSFLESFEKEEAFNSSQYKKYDISYAKNDLKRLTIEFYSQNGEGNSFSEEEFEIIYNRIEGEINSALKFLPSSILDKLASAVKYASTIKTVFTVMKLFLIPSVILLLSIVVLNIKKGIPTLIYRTGSSLFFPSAILFIPTFLFDNYNVGSKVAIMHSPLSVVFSTLTDTTVKGFETFTGVIFLFAFLLLIAGAVLTVLEIGKPKE